jgi:hypothetical protein
VPITFELVDAYSRPCDAWDAVSGERILPIKKTVVTSTGVSPETLLAGEFTVSLWPNDRGSEATFYLCTVKSPGVRQFLAALSSGPAPIAWIDFMAQGAPLTTTDLSALKEFLAQINDSELAAAGSASASAVSAGESASSAAASLVSENAAAGSAVEANNSVIAAAASKDTAISKADESSASADNAAGSALAAAGSEDVATQKAAGASASELNATDKAGIATTKAAEAAGSAGDAADSADAAAQSVITIGGAAQIALDKAATAADRVQTGLDVTAADASATAADASATAADASATAADASATAADASATAADASAALARGETVVQLGNVSGTQVLDMSLGTYFVASAIGPCNWTFINPQPGYTGVTLRLYNGCWLGQIFVGVGWPYGRMPSLTIAGWDRLEFTSDDDWITIDGVISSRNSLVPV